jgi:hypothetical protein
MAAQTVADALIDSMIRVSMQKAAEGKVDETVKTVSMYIDSLEKQNESTRKVYGKKMCMLFALRAKVVADAAYSGKGAADVGSATADIGRAKQAFEQYHAQVEPSVAQEIGAAISGLADPDAKVRDGNLAKIEKYVQSVSSAAAQTPVKGGAGVKLGLRALFFLVGLVMWGLMVLLFFLPIRFGTGSSNAATYILMAPGIVLMVVNINCAVSGWGWLAGRGSSGQRLKAIVIVGLICTGVGLLFDMYWTGRGFLGWIARKRGW